MKYHIHKYALIGVYHLKIRITVFSLAQNEPFTSTQGARAHHVTLSCFYSNPEWTQPSQVLLHAWRGGKGVHHQMPLNLTHWSFNIGNVWNVIQRTDIRLFRLFKQKIRWMYPVLKEASINFVICQQHQINQGVLINDPILIAKWSCCLFLFKFEHQSGTEWKMLFFNYQ